MRRKMNPKELGKMFNSKEKKEWRQKKEGWIATVWVCQGSKSTPYFRKHPRGSKRFKTKDEAIQWLISEKRRYYRIKDISDFVIMKDLYMNNEFDAKPEDHGIRNNSFITFDLYNYYTEYFKFTIRNNSFIAFDSYNYYTEYFKFTIRDDVKTIRKAEWK